VVGGSSQEAVVAEHKVNSNLSDFEQELSRLQGAMYRNKTQGLEPQGGASLVLGAGERAAVVADTTSTHTSSNLEPGFKQQLSCLQGAIYRTKAKGLKSHGGVSLVLGAGNQASVVAGDILFKLIHEDEVVIVKTNPVNEYVGKHLE